MVTHQLQVERRTGKVRQSETDVLPLCYDYVTILPNLRSTYDCRLIYKTSYEGRRAFLRYSSLAESYDRLR